jgi:SprT protein
MDGFDAEMREFVLELQKKAQKQTEYYVRLAESRYGRSFPMPVIAFNNLGTTAGRAWIGKNLIEYCPRIMRLNAEDFLVETTGHEVAHLIAHHLHDANRIIQPHGDEWMKVMWAFGLPARECHNYDTGLKPPKPRVAPYVTHDDRRIVEKRGAKIITFE